MEGNIVEWDKEIDWTEFGLEMNGPCMTSIFTAAGGYVS